MNSNTSKSVTAVTKTKVCNNRKNGKEAIQPLVAEESKKEVKT